MSKVIVFGATGSVGAYTAIGLKKAGFDVIAVGRRTADNGFFADYDIPYYSVDITLQEDFVKLPTDISQVINFAGAMPARISGEVVPYDYINSIIIGSVNILEWMRSINASKIIFSQSIADVSHLYGSKEPIEDDVQRRFPLNNDHSIYSISKNTVVDLMEHYHAKYGIKRFVLRLPNIYVYHPNPFYYVDGVKKYSGYRYIIEQAVKGETLEVWGDPNSMKETVYVKDFVQLVQKCVESDLDGGIYNVASGCPSTIEYQIKEIANVFAGQKKSDIVYCPEKPSSPEYVFSIEKAQRELGYFPKYDFHALLVDFKAEMENNPMEKLWGRRSDF